MLSLRRLPVLFALQLIATVALYSIHAQAADDSQTPLTEFKSQFKEVRKNLRGGEWQDPERRQRNRKAVRPASRPQAS